MIKNNRGCRPIPCQRNRLNSPFSPGGFGAVPVLLALEGLHRPTPHEELLVALDARLPRGRVCLFPRPLDLRLASLALGGTPGRIRRRGPRAIPPSASLLLRLLGITGIWGFVGSRGLGREELLAATVDEVDRVALRQLPLQPHGS